MKEDLRNALLAAREGDEGRARLILAEFLRREPDNVAAWVLLSKLAETHVQKAAFLRKILDLDPNHAYAKETLQQMGQAPAPVISQQLESPSRLHATPPGPAPVPESEAEQSAGAFDFDFGQESDVAGEGAQRDFAAEDPFAEEPEPQEQYTERWPVSETPDDFDAQAEGDTIPPWVDADQAPYETSTPSPAVDESEDELPDWLREESGDEWLDEQTEARYARGASDTGDSEESTADERAARLSAAMAAQTPAIVIDPESENGRGWLLPLLLVIAVLIFLVLVYVVLTTFL